MADTPWDHIGSSEVTVLPLAKPMFSRVFRLADKIGVTDKQLKVFQKVLRSYWNQMYKHHAEIIREKNKLRQLIVDLTDRKARNWKPIFETVRKIHTAALFLDLVYYKHMKQGADILSSEQTKKLMSFYEKEELAIPQYNMPTRVSRKRKKQRRVRRKH